MFISPAYAQGIGGDMGALGSFLPLILIFVVFYFLLIRPQQKKQKAHREMLAALHRGDRIVTAGGLVGTITKVLSDTEVTVEISEGVKVRVMRGMISDVIAKTEARSSSAKSSGANTASDDGDEKKAKKGKEKSTE